MITHHPDLVQGSDEWLQTRCGLITASEMKLLITPTLKVADNDKTRAHIYELAAQRITKYVEPQYVSDDMLRGQVDEIDAKYLYSCHYAPVTDVGFITNDDHGFMLGYSPDGLVGDDGLIEVKSRRQKYQIETIVGGVMPSDYAIQVQTGLLVSGRKWCDFWSHSGGLPTRPMRVFPDAVIQAAILVAATSAEARIREVVVQYEAATGSGKWIQTERKVEQEMHL